MKDSLLQKRDFSDGISKIIATLPELVMDSPRIHHIVFDYIIKPLLDEKILNLKMVKWDMKPETDEEEEDDVLFEEFDI